jgi:sarcosine oxidase delta subunit
MATTIDPARSKRFKDEFGAQGEAKQKPPGPGQYTPKGQLNKTGEYFNSKLASSGCRSHYHFNRTTFTYRNLSNLNITFRYPRAWSLQTSF